jgi:hypothetical protein
MKRTERSLKTFYRSSGPGRAKTFPLLSFAPAPPALDVNWLFLSVVFPPVLRQTAKQSTEELLRSNKVNRARLDLYESENFYRSRLLTKLKARLWVIGSGLIWSHGSLPRLLCSTWRTSFICKPVANDPNRGQTRRE